MNISLKELKTYAKQFVDGLEKKEGHAVVYGLKGNLGAGKTTFVQHVAHELGVEESITSPTFVIAQVYKTKHPVFKKLVHIDAYRLEDEEKDTIGFSDYIKEPGNLVFVEWPEYVPGGLPKDAEIISFETVDEETRNINHGEK